MRSMKEVDASVSAGCRLEARSKVVLQDRAEELMIARHENDGLSLQLRSRRQPFHGSRTAAVGIACDHGNVELPLGLRKSDWLVLLSVEIG